MRRGRLLLLGLALAPLGCRTPPPRAGELLEVLGDERRAVVGRELTKLHEEFVRGTLPELARWATDQPKGEIVLVVEGRPPVGEPDDAELIAALEEHLADGMTRRDAVADVAARLGAARRRVYELALGIDDE